MTDPHSTIPEHAKPALWRRYEDWRLARYEKSRDKYAHRWPGLRNRRSFRRLVVALALMQLLVVAAAVIAFFSSGWFLIPFVLGLGGSVGVLTVLRAVTSSIIDAPVAALDEIQLAQRNSARSIGYFAVFSLTFIPYFVLIFMGSAFDMVKGQNVYGMGVLLIAVVYIGASVPTMLTAWWMADPDPEDFADEIDDTADDPDPAPALAPISTPDTASSVPQPDPLPGSAGTTTARNDPPAPAPW